MELRFELRSRRRMRRMTKNARRQEAAIARKPSTTMTAMAQCGKGEFEEADCTCPPGEEVGVLVFVDVRWARDDEDASAAEAEDADAEDADAAEEEAAITESANVVSVTCLRSVEGLRKKGGVLTDGGKSRLSERVAIKSCLTAYKYPIEGIANVFPIPFATICTPPRVIDLGANMACLVGRVW